MGAGAADGQQVLNVNEILSRDYLEPGEAALIKQLLSHLEDMLHATNPEKGVRRFQIKSGNNSYITWVRVAQNRVPDSNAGMKQQRRRGETVNYVMGTTGAGVETAARMIRKRRAMFTEAASRASILSKEHLGAEATLQANARGLDTTRLRGPGGGPATIRALRAFGGARDMRGRRRGRLD